MPISRLSGSAGKRVIVMVTACVVLSAAFASTASASPVTGKLIKVGPKLSVNTNTSNNWFGYNLGALGDGDKLFSSITGSWTVPTATQHTTGQAEDSADWIGIGGGCVDSGCDATDETLIQTGTEQDVSSTGAASYDAWYELVPAPEIEISNMTVDPGDQMHASLTQLAGESNVWQVTIQDVTRNETYSTTVPYSSTQSTAEWIEETPLEIGTSPGLAALPNLTNPAWNALTVNGGNPGLNTSEEMDLVDSSGNVIGSPSAPNSTTNGFDECTWTSTCS
ncbi:MAG TPA: G1 family glutamic endopeptidase [Solirubrobacteraceae bacterium]|nr:G1 family glutamic endopeptidase [Solirubrobacteraceae bacterium]